MPYRKISDLPDAVKNHLPISAQKIFVEAFNNAWEQYSDPKKRNTPSSQEEIAHKVAWSAVKKVYYKDEKGKWVKIKKD